MRWSSVVTSSRACSMYCDVTAGRSSWGVSSPSMRITGGLGTLRWRSDAPFSTESRSSSFIFTTVSFLALARSVDVALL